MVGFRPHSSCTESFDKLPAKSEPASWCSHAVLAKKRPKGAAEFGLPFHFIPFVIPLYLFCTQVGSIRQELFVVGSVESNKKKVNHNL